MRIIIEIDRDDVSATSGASQTVAIDSASGSTTAPEALAQVSTAKAMDAGSAPAEIMALGARFAPTQSMAEISSRAGVADTAAGEAPNFPHSIESIGEAD